MQQLALAGAERTEHAENLSPMDFEVDRSHVDAAKVRFRDPPVSDRERRRLRAVACLLTERGVGPLAGASPGAEHGMDHASMVLVSSRRVEDLAAIAQYYDAVADSKDLVDAMR